MPGVILQSRVRQTDPQGAGAPPPPGIFEQFMPALRVAVDEEELPQADRLATEYMALADALVEMGVERSSLYSKKATPGFVMAASRGAAPQAGMELDRDKVFAAIADVRKRKPKAFSNVKDSREAHEQWVLGRRGGRQRDQQLLARNNSWAGTGVQILGASAGSFADPINVAALPIGGGGKTLASKVLTEALIGSGVEALQIPGRIDSRANLGEETTLGDIALDVAAAGIGAGVVRGGFEAVPLARNATASALEKAVAAHWDRLPAALQQRWAKRSEIAGRPAEDILLADIAEAAIPPEKLTDAERGAINALRREGIFAQANPFVPDGAGIETHYAMLGDAIQGIINETPAYVPKIRPSPGARLRFDGSTGLSSGVVPGRGGTLTSDDAAIKRMIAGAESGGRDIDNMMGAPVAGRYQFYRPTFVAMYQRVYGVNKATAQQAWNTKRNNAQVQEALMDATLKEYRQILQKAGLPYDAGNAYLAHFAGPEKAVQMLKADPNTPISKFFSAEQTRLNPTFVKQGGTVGQTIGLVRGKMGERAAGAPAARSPAGGGRLTPVDDGGAVIRSIFGKGVQITQTKRDPNSALGRKNPGSWHNRTNAAVDMKAVKGMTFEEAKARIEGAGYRLIEAIDEYKNPSPHATGPHWHFVIGQGGDGAPGGSAIAPDDPDIMARLDRELSETQQDIARLDSELAGESGDVGRTADELAASAEPVAGPSPLPRIDAPEAPDLRSDVEVAGMTPEARAIMPDLRLIVDTERNVSLNDAAALSSRLGVDERNLQAALQQMAIDGLVLRTARGTFQRLPRRKDGPEDLLTFVAARGGLADNEGHDLATIFERERVVRWKRKPDANGQGGIPLKEPYRTTRPALVPGIGPLVRRETGRSLDDMGEELWDAGFFGPPDSVPRPTTSDVIDLIRNAFDSGEKVYSFYDQGAALDAQLASEIASPSNPFRSDFQNDEHFLYEWRQFDAIAEEQFGITLDEEAFAGAWRAYREAGDGDIAGAVLTAIQREIEDVQARELADMGLTDAEDILAEWEAALRADGLLGGEEIPAGRFDPADPGPDGPPRGPASWEEAGPIEPEQWQGWDDPEGPAAQLTTDSMEHDLRVGVSSLHARRLEGFEGLLQQDKPDLRQVQDAIEYLDEAYAQGLDIGPLQDRLIDLEKRIYAARQPANDLDAETPLERAEREAIQAEDRWYEVAFKDERRDADRRTKEYKQWEREADALEATKDEALARFRLLREQQAPAMRPLTTAQRIGDFIEFFDDEARLLANALDVAIAKRNGRDMVGIPVHSIESYREAAAKAGLRMPDLDDAGRLIEADGPTITTAPDGQTDFAAPTGAQVRTALERQTEGGIRATGPQRAPGEDGGLFDNRDTTGDMLDPAADAPAGNDLFEGLAFRLDEEGDVVNPADLLAEFDEDATFIKTIRDCL